jgi:hypothetical protein
MRSPCFLVTLLFLSIYLSVYPPPIPWNICLQAYVIVSLHSHFPVEPQTQTTLYDATLINGF